MKSRYIIYVLLLFVIFSCGQRGRHSSLSNAETLLSCNPDSALHILESCSDSVKDWSKGDRMNYILLKTSAQDKCFINITSDMEMLEVVDYFEHHGTPLKRLTAYYTLGRVYSDMMLAGDAINYYKKALNMDDLNDSASLVVRGLSAEWIAETMMYQEIFAEALPYFKMADSLVSMSRNYSVESFILRNIGRNLLTQKDTTKGIAYFYKGADLALSIHDSATYKNIISELPGTFMDMKDFKRAKWAIDASCDTANIALHDIACNNECIARYYYETGNIDSAIYFYSKCLNTENIYVNMKSTSMLADILANRNRTKEALALLHKCINYKDTLNASTEKQNKSLINTLNKKLEDEKKQDHKSLVLTNVIFILVLLLIAVAITTFYFIWKRRVKAKKQDEKIRELRDYVNANSTATINEHKKKIAELESTISDMQANYDELEKAKMVAEKEVHRQTVGKIESENKVREIRIQKFKASDIYSRFHSQQFIPTNSDYEELEKYLNATYDNCIKKIKELYADINTNELYLCMLLKADLPLKMIANNLNIKSNNIYMIRRRLYAKIFKQKGSAADLDKFIDEL
jgi:tetratricopeptide (TPR) repeat protein